MFKIDAIFFRVFLIQSWLDPQRQNPQIQRTDCIQNQKLRIYILACIIVQKLINTINITGLFGDTNHSLGNFVLVFYYCLTTPKREVKSDYYFIFSEHVSGTEAGLPWVILSILGGITLGHSVVVGQQLDLSGGVMKALGISWCLERGSWKPGFCCVPSCILT